MIIPNDEVTTDEVKSWSGVHLLHFQGSACSQKVRILLREKGSIEAIYQDLDSVSGLPMRGAARTERLLGENRDQAFLMKRLTSIVRDVSLDVDLERAALRVAV